MHINDRILAWSHLNSMTRQLINVANTVTDVIDPKKPGADRIKEMLRDQIELTEEALDSSLSAFSGKED
ncbi:hypothetical protein [Marinobacter sp.]|mgnify:FL=1|jgi:hypothetical protein|uniref:hypothetical protein n=1 Tax=Marinobacter sp. TaxID=50741 RepID=UPI000C924320|nr:hypothetical protein [Marinobacter sp.]MAK52186.1 hypothetical protein [Marinobacter sp.]